MSGVKHFVVPFHCKNMFYRGRECKRKSCHKSKGYLVETYGYNEKDYNEKNGDKPP